jgi:putative alpha-1,2-mannosidase
VGGAGGRGGDNAVVVSVGLSFLDMAGAERNWAAGVRDRSFDAVADATAATWAEALRILTVRPCAPASAYVHTQ